MTQVKKKKKLVLITDEFPYAQAEASFLGPELPHLIERFDVTIVCKSASKTQLVPVDPAVRVLHYRRPGPLRHVFDTFALPFARDFWSECRAIFAARTRRFGRLLFSAYFMTEARCFTRYLLRERLVGLGADADVYYSYWNNYAAYALTRAKERGLTGNAKVVTRTHGYDLYDERQPFFRQQLKKQTDRSLDRVYFVSEQGRAYYLAHHACGDGDGEKYALYRMGVPDRGLGPVPDGATLRLYSCSSALPVKRIDLLIEALALLDGFPVEWTHFGGGPKLEKLKTQADSLLGVKPNVRFAFAGRVPNGALMETLADTPFDCCVNVSSSEGLPVSLMEACSFGIPVVATNVGGSAEIAGKGNGILLPADPEPAEVAAALAALAALPQEKKLALRQCARELYEREFCAKINYARFADDLLKLAGG